MASIREFLKTNRIDVAVLTLLFIAALGIKFYFLRFYLVISADGIGYANIARALFRPGGMASATHFPPFYPFLVALLNQLLGDVELSGRLVSMIMGSLLVVPLYLLGARFFTRRVGLLACLLAITWPSLRAWSGEVMSQGTYITLVFGGLYLLTLATQRRSKTIGLTAGALMGLAYLTRPEAFIIFVAVTPFLIALSRSDGDSWKKAVTIPLTSWLVFWVLAFPYVLLLHNETGAWQLTAKAGATLWVGLGQYLGKFDVYREPGFQGIGFLDIIRDYPGFIPYNIQNNLRAIANEMLPPYFWVLALFGFFVGGWKRRQIIDRMLLLATFSPLAVIVVFFLAAPEYTQLSLPILLLWVGRGAVAVESGLLRLLPDGMQAFLRRNSLSLAVIAFLSLKTLIAQIPGDRDKPYNYEQDGGRYDHKRIALMLKQYLPAGATIMTRAGRIKFYSELPSIDIPQTDEKTIYDYGRKNGANYLIVDGMLMGQRPQLQALFTPLIIGPEKMLFVAKGSEFVPVPVPGLRLYFLFKDPSSLGVAVYEFVN